MNILVTGGHGFVGRALIEKLREKFPKDQIFAPSSSELDLFDERSTQNYLEGVAPNRIIHLAAKLGGVGLVTNRPSEFLKNNLRINLNLLSAIEKMGGVHLITLGSSCCYAENAPLPNRESDLWSGHPENTYGVCKLVLLEQLIHQRFFDWTYFIPPNIYGPGDHFGDEHAHFIPAVTKKLLDAAADRRGEIEVWGDGTQTRDFVYIDDVVFFLLEALEDTRYAGRPVNLGTGKETSIREITLKIREILGLADKVEICWAPDKPTGTKRKVLSNENLRDLAPDYNFVDINTGLYKTIKAWM